jgi:hypothetical protein
VTDAQQHALYFVAPSGESTDRVNIGREPQCWQERPNENGPVWLVVPVRNVGTGPAFIPFEEGSLAAQVQLYGGLRATGRPSSRAVAPSDTAYLVFRQPYGSPAPISISLRLGEMDVDLVVVRYTGIDTGRPMRTRLALRQFNAPRFMDVEATIEDGP